MHAQPAPRLHEIAAHGILQVKSAIKIYARYTAPACSLGLF